MVFNDALTDLNTTLGDSANTTFTVAEKTRALTKAFNDTYVTTFDIWDTSLSYTQGTYQYPVPASMTVVQEIYISPNGATEPFPEPIDKTLYEVVGTNIQFRQKADWIIPSNYTLYIKGRKKLDTTATISDMIQYEYILALAGYNTLTLLSHKKANLFVKNDTTMSELIALRRELLAEVKEFRARLQKQAESV